MNERRPNKIEVVLFDDLDEVTQKKIFELYNPNVTQFPLTISENYDCLVLCNAPDKNEIDVQKNHEIFLEIFNHILKYKYKMVTFHFKFHPNVQKQIKTKLEHMFNTLKAFL